MKLEKIIKSKTALLELSNKDVSISIGVKIKRALEEYNAIESLYQEKVNNLYQSLGEEFGGNGDYKILPENVDKFNDKVNKLHNEEVFEDVEKYKINLSTLNQNNITLKPALLVDLEWILVDDIE